MPDSEATASTTCSQLSTTRSNWWEPIASHDTLDPVIDSASDRLGERSGHELGARERCEFDQPDTVTVEFEPSAGDRDRRTRLPGSASSGEADAPGLANGPADCIQFIGPADEARYLGGQVVRRRRRSVCARNEPVVVQQDLSFEVDQLR